MFKSTIQSVIDELVSIEADNECNNVETFAKLYSDRDEFVIQLNEAAAVYLCRLILDTVSKPFPGAHQHLDYINFIDEGDVRLRIENV